MHVLLATDATWLADDVVAALGDENTSFTVCTEGRVVSDQVAKIDERGGSFDIGIFDLQIGSMGGMAVTMALRLDASLGHAPAIPVLMLLDRVADVHLAKRSGADGWLVKPLDPLRLRRAVRTVASGGVYTEGLVDPATALKPIRTGGDGSGGSTVDPSPGIKAPVAEDSEPIDQSGGPEPVPAG